jgi:hypothetical protein
MDFVLAGTGLYIFAVVGNYFARRLGQLNGGAESRHDSFFIALISSTAVMVFSFAILGFLKLVGVL